MTTFSLVIILVSLTFLGYTLFRLGTKMSYNAGYEKGRAESTVVVVPSQNNLGGFLFLIILVFALFAYLAG